MFDLYFEDNYFNRLHMMCGERKEIFNFIYDYLHGHGYVVPYCRTWHEGDEEWVDFGSHSEFFIIKEAAVDAEM